MKTQNSNTGNHTSSKAGVIKPMPSTKPSKTIPDKKDQPVKNPKMGISGNCGKMEAKAATDTSACGIKSGGTKAVNDKASAKAVKKN